VSPIKKVPGTREEYLWVDSKGWSYINQSRLKARGKDRAHRTGLVCRKVKLANKWTARGGKVWLDGQGCKLMVLRSRHVRDLVQSESEWDQVTK